ncbi:MAG: ubiquinol-cytochrome C chaperone family protein [Parvularculales bacterium]
MFKGFRAKKQAKNTLADVYRVVVGQARLPAFYRDFGVPDTVDGRFDMIVLHMALCLRRLRAADADLDDQAQALFDFMFSDMDYALREMGAGDMSVGRRIRAMVEAFYGRTKTYDKALDAGDGEMLTDALARNVFPDCKPPVAAAHRLAEYVIQAEAALAGVPVTDILAGGFGFCDPAAALNCP